MGFIINEYSPHCYEAFWRSPMQSTRAYAQSGQNHTIAEIRVHLTPVRMLVPKVVGL